MKFQSFFQKKRKRALIVLFLCFTAIFSVYAQTRGDVNTDGNINIIDALMTAQYYVGLNVPNFTAANADVDRSGSINIVDALMIAQYYVGLIITFPGDATPTPTKTPGGSKPKAAFTISNIVPQANEIVTFDASGSADPDGTITGYAWDFDDGTTGTGVRVTHAFAEVDDFKVVLTVTDNSGLTDKKSHRVFIGRPQGWTEDTHHKSADPDYDLLFPEDKVQRMDITISASDYTAIENDLARLTMQSTTDPMYVPATVAYNGYTWWHVGFRYKGQSSLFSAKQSNIHKYPFRLNFDKLEDNYPEINNQRFYGFKEMTFCSNWNDQSFMREKVCSDIFRAGGLATARGSFMRVYIDTGTGPKYWGLYIMVEDPSDALLGAQFEDDSGNAYKPEGTGADWRNPFVQNAFIKKTNEDEADWSDVRAAHTALHASRSNAATWRANLEAAFNVRVFLRWLAINTSVVNWDSYGQMAQNYYLYQNPADGGRIHWIPWDFNLSMMNGMMGRTLSFSLSEVSSSWPLIRFLMDDPVYKDIYNQEMRTAIDGCFDQTTVVTQVQTIAAMIKPYVVGVDGEISGYTFLRNGESGFNQAITELVNFINSRQTATRNYLNSL